MAAFQGNINTLLEFMAARDREGHNRENRATVFVYLIYVSLVFLCLWNWVWQYYIRPELTIPLG